MERSAHDEFDLDVLAQIWPNDWTNPPDAARRYDLAVIGGGALGVLAAEYARSQGASVALASDQPLGRDALSEALPRASLATAADVARQVRAARASAWPEARLGPFDFAAWRRSLAAETRLAAGRFAAAELAGQGIAVRLGSLTFQGPDSLRVGGQSLLFDRALLCLPAHCALPPMPGLAETHPALPDRLAGLEQMPRRWAILGGGVAACELAQAFVTLGAEVELITAAPRPLADDDQAGAGLSTLQHAVAGCPAVAELVERRLAADGVALRLGWSALEASRAGAAKGLLLARGAERQKSLADEILLVAERRLDLEWLRLDAAGIGVGPRGPMTDARLKTSNPRVFAVNPDQLPDIQDSEYLADLAGWAVERALGRAELAATWITAPRRLRVDPPIAWLGDGAAWSVSGPEILDVCIPTENPAFADSSPAASEIPRSEPERSQTPPAYERGGWVALRIDGRRDRLLGAVLIGSAAQDLSAALALAVDRGETGWRDVANDPARGRQRLNLLLSSPPVAPPAFRGWSWWRNFFDLRPRRR